MNFSTDSRFFRIMSRVADCMILSILWFLFSLPIITAGATTASLYYCVCKVLREEQGYAVSSFWHSFRSNLKQGTLITLIFLAAALGAGAYIRMQAEAARPDIYVVSLLAAVFAIAWLHCLLTYIAKFRTGFGTVLKNSLVICIANFPISVMLVIFLTAVVLVMVLNLPRTLGAMLFVPAVYMLLVSFPMERIYRKYLPPEEIPETSENE